MGWGPEVAKPIFCTMQDAIIDVHARQLSIKTGSDGLPVSSSGAVRVVCTKGID